ncbi:MAG TPA: ATP-binding protein [Puia sp.]|jgi:signal transduction histidine kinase|nr:ATP-binding protein [Puia sp.]
MKTAIRQFTTDLRVRVGYGTAFFLLLSSYLLTLYANSELLKEALLVDHSNKIIIETEALASDIKDAESGFRGYLLMNDPRFLFPYKESRHAVDSVYSGLIMETTRDKDEHSSLATLRRLIDKKYDVMDAGLAENNRHPIQSFDSTRILRYFSLEIMNHIRSLVSEIQATERQRLHTRLAGMSSRYRTLNNVIILSLGMAIIMALLGFYTYSHENKARREADRRVAEYQRQLQERIGDLDKANKELIRMRSIEKFAATGRIARTIAHEVRNPLTNINLAVEQLQTELNGLRPENGERMLEMINRNSARINLLITDLLNSTKFTDLVYTKASVNNLLEDTLELARDRIQLKRITVTRNYSAGMPDLSVDAERIKIAFLNIIVNAVEAMEPVQGVLRLTTLGRDSKCIIQIADNGSGIAEESQSRIFEPYFTNKQKGTGLGLTNTQNIILNHNGQIAFESKKGEGTTFTIQLPTHIR